MKHNWINVLALVLSYVVLFFLPRNLTVTSYVILGISIFLFMIGYFRLQMIYGWFSDHIGYRMTNVLSDIIGMGLMAFGTVYLYISHSNGKGMVVVFLLMMEGLAFMATSAGEVIDLKVDRNMALVMRMFALCLIAFVVFYIVTDIEKGLPSAVLILIEIVMVLIMSNINAHKERIAKMKISVKEFCEKYGQVKTVFGEPRVGEADGHKECIIYGPNENGVFVYGYYMLGQFILALGSEGNREVSHEDAEVLDRYKEMFENYTATGKMKFS
ncbi:hypothetical protein [Butyrivibrio sp. MB2005]|uniref:hypothetical protein n=1 Tax=Butyrivibrio sp. MB2005 TaxID=1280678 RepID=UPI00040794E9|nr:hypothetical protein [Butyrivibrio sp. MB2005]